MDNFDPYNVFLAIAINIPQRLKTGFVLQGHKSEIIYIKSMSISFQVTLECLPMLINAE